MGLVSGHINTRTGRLLFIRQHYFLLYGNMAEMLADAIDSLFVFLFKQKPESICSQQYYSESKFEVNIVDTLLLLLSLRKTGLIVIIILPTLSDPKLLSEFSFHILLTKMGRFFITPDPLFMYEVNGGTSWPFKTPTLTS